MNNPPFLFLKVTIFFFFLLTLSIIKTPAQNAEPDEDIRREMIAYSKKVSMSLEITRPRVIQNAVLIDSKSYIQNESLEQQLATVAEKSSQLERQAFEILNQKRADEGLEPLKWSEELARVARLHSVNMARYKFFSHAGADGSMVNDRADALGISSWRSIGENIAFNRGFKKPVESACEQWMNSPSHRENILNKRWKEAGVGMAIAPDGTYYFTEVFILK